MPLKPSSRRRTVVDLLIEFSPAIALFIVGVIVVVMEYMNLRK